MPSGAVACKARCEAVELEARAESFKSYLVSDTSMPRGRVKAFGTAGGICASRRPKRVRRAEVEG